MQNPVNSKEMKQNFEKNEPKLWWAKDSILSQTNTAIIK